MSELTDKIKSRAYWDVAILPEPHKAERYLYETLDEVLARATVRLRGWPVPFIDSGSELERGEDWIGQEVDAQGLGQDEAWRFFMSGQFSQLRAVSADWRTGDEATPNPPRFNYERVIEVWEILYYVTEIFELAARFAMGGPAQDRTKIVATLHGLTNRGLVVAQNNRIPFASRYEATIPQYSRSTTLSRDALLAGASDAAIHMSREFFLRFGWQPSTEQLAEMQRELTGAGW
jgi:hypothetical protein